jgi:hypothetical protein
VVLQEAGIPQALPSWKAIGTFVLCR